MNKNNINNLDSHTKDETIKGDDNMEALREDCLSLQECLDKISSKTKILGGKNGIISLSKKNPEHVQWYQNEDDDNK
ncbi:hypothetical protein [Alkaliphilus metalliredigens]|uniref:hypothetical protein n=1 Tax=Alkaliphilus metalliredigens TaxID=208226 RepID=UPI0005A2B0CF|nr:hypothetical protein [Alkaliphilus metalliredigens]